MTDGGPPLVFFAGIAGAADDLILEHIRMDGSLQAETSELFRSQEKAFKDDDHEAVDYNPKDIYRLERGQVYVIRNLPLPTGYMESITKPHQTDDFVLGKKPLPNIATILGAETSGKKVSKVLFQQFRSPQLLDRKRVLFWTGSVFDKLTNDSISLSNEIAAIWVGNSLYFKSFYTVSRFFDLAEYEPKATPEEITSFVETAVFHFETEEKQLAIYNLIANDDFLSRRVASITAKKILDSVSPRKASNKAKEFGVQIKTVQDGNKKLRISLPFTKKELKHVVKFLNEEYFHGELTEELYETNSLKRIS